MPIYTYNGFECVSAGVLFYRRGNTFEFLFLETVDRKGNLILEDPGGKSQSGDVSIEMVAAREAAEELNAEIQPDGIAMNDMTYQERVDSSRDYILKLIASRPICVSNPRNKYALFVVELPNRDWDFGTKEFHPKYDIYRTARWLPLDEVPRIQIHPRIRHLLKYL